MSLFWLVIRKIETNFRKFLFVVVIFLFSYVKITENRLVTPTYPLPFNETISTAYEFVPLATIIGFGFLGVCFLLLAIAKIMYQSSNQYMMNNQYDLVIFKPPTKNSNNGPCRVYSNVNANAHNLNAAANCGFDVSMLNARNPYTAFLSGISSLNQSNKNN